MIVLATWFLSLQLLSLVAGVDFVEMDGPVVVLKLKVK
jgi:hypothetical protein